MSQDETPVPLPELPDSKGYTAEVECDAPSGLYVLDRSQVH
jgi:hypothetical protein